jgi:hypothetical protein
VCMCGWVGVVSGWTNKQKETMMMRDAPSVDGCNHEPFLPFDARMALRLLQLVAV